ncbi:MAG: ribokinase, partial [Methylomonas sp.]
GIDVAGVKRLKNTATGTAFVTVSESAENVIVVIAGANAMWNDGFLDDVHVEAGDIVLAQFEVPDQVISQAFRKARDRGAMTILNPAPVRAIDSDIRQLTDLLVINEHELAELAGADINAENDESVFNAAERLANDGYRAVIVTLGNNGVRLLHSGRKHRMAARPVRAVDTTGAGDTFIGGLSAGLMSGLDLIRAAEFGNVAASISVTRQGAASSIPTIEEVNRILQAEQMGN